MYSAIEKLQKFFNLESERGFDNRAVVGGLDKILPSWEKEALAEGFSPSVIQTISAKLNVYNELSLEGRASTIQDILTMLSETDSSPETEDQPPTEAVASPSLPAQSTQVKPVQEETAIRTKPARSASLSKPHSQGPAVGLNAPLTVLSGIGKRHAQTFQKLGVNTLADLLYYFPRRYDDYSQLKPINRLNYEEEVTVIATVHSASTRNTRGGKLQITEVTVTDGTGFLRLNWFNQPWLEPRLKPGTEIVLSGKIDMYLGRLIINNPEWEPLEQQHLHTNRIVPVYPLTARITQRWLRRIMFQTIPFWASRIKDFLPESIRTEASLMDIKTALKEIHFPESLDNLRDAQNRLAFDEIFLLQLGVLKQKYMYHAEEAKIYQISPEWFTQQIAQLPFELTAAQQRVLGEVREDLASGHPMNRLLQGDVGSGKTVIAALAIAIVTQAGDQAAIMAPTSILAEQHYRSMLRLLTGQTETGEQLLAPEEIRLLVGDTSNSDKEEIRSGLKEGTIKVVVGTHALIEDPVEFQHLHLAVIDEQHRFGVAQRAKLRDKGQNPHILVMTATPIPRSLALTLYGDLDVSVMDEMPAGRQPIETHVLHPRERERGYQVIRSQIRAGHQAFMIYPLVENNEDDDSERKAAVDEHKRLQKEVFPDLNLGLLHGRLKPDEKESVMADFRDGKYHILVSTSVVEVGVDIPNATVMLIEGANRFGLAQLHQFRGRVGRGEEHSFCLLIPETEDALENERLKVMTETNDGFVLAERDLEQRGPGQFLGTQQSGFSELKMASLSNIKLIEIARNQAKRLFEKDPYLTEPEHQDLSRMVQRFWKGGSGDVS